MTAQCNGYGGGFMCACVCVRMFLLLFVCVCVFVIMMLGLNYAVPDDAVYVCCDGDFA